MERNFRFRVSGLVFIMILLLHLGFTYCGKAFITCLKTDQTNLSVIQILIGAALIVFASDSIGFIFSSISVFIFNRMGGYTRIYKRKLGYSGLKGSIMQIYESMDSKLPNDFSHDNFQQRWSNYNTEHFLASFFWHRSDLPNTLNEWIERRHTAYFTSYSYLTAAILGSILSFITIFALKLGVSWANLIILLTTGIVSWIVVKNGEDAMKDALAIIDLRIAGYVNPGVKNIFNHYFEYHKMSNNDDAA